MIGRSGRLTVKPKFSGGHLWSRWPGGTRAQIDGQYGKLTAEAVTSFQASNGLAAVGEVDEDTWTKLMQGPIPELKERALQLTTAFEGHGFTLAQGNFDGAGVTWGIIGFTLISGELGRIIKQVAADHPGLV
jgi:hypothetical protein